MPLKLVPPRAGKTPFWSIRGTYLGCYIDRSTGSREKTFAAKLLQKLKRDIESGVLSGKKAIGFAKAAAAYMKAGGDSKYLAPLIKHFLHTPIEDIDQVMIDNVAVEIYPNATAATRNRQVYTPISAMLKRAGIERQIKRPKGWRGRKLTHWLTPEQARRVFKATARIEAPEKTKIKFRIYLRMLCYTGMRMNEPLQKLAKPDVNLKTATAILRDMKNWPFAARAPAADCGSGLAPAAWRAQGHRETVFLPRRRPTTRPLEDDACRGGRRPAAARRLPCVLPHMGDVDEAARRARYLRSRAHRPLGRSRIGRPLCACGGERAGAAGRSAAGCEAQGRMILGESVDNVNCSMTSMRRLPFTRERS
jgi:integrase